MKNDTALVSIVILAWNGKAYLNDCIASVAAQSYPNIELTVIDNNSEDGSRKILCQLQKDIRIHGKQFTLVENDHNVGFAKGHNQGIVATKGEYYLALNQDVLLSKDFVRKAVDICLTDEVIGAVQGKILQYDLMRKQRTKIIDTVGLTAFKSWRIIDEGQGQQDNGQYDSPHGLFLVNGVAPLFRRKALEVISLNGEYFDEDFFAYGEDVDISWRLNLYGWKCVYTPEAIAWHDRTTSKKSGSSYAEFIARRKQISPWARRIGWRNQHLLFFKNADISLLFRCLFKVCWREFQLLLYLILFERSTLAAIPELFKLLPVIKEKRRIIMRQRAVPPSQIIKWFQ